MSTTPADPVPPASAAAQLQVVQALRRARLAIAWERAWPHLARFLTVIGAFLALSWAGLWLVLPLWGRLAALAAVALLALAVLVPLVRLRWPSREDALRRLDLKTGLAHRPATALTDTLTSRDEMTRSLWQAEQARLKRSLTRLRAGVPEPQLPRHAPLALRALVVVALVAAFFAAGGERGARLAAAFDWNGALLTPANIRVDAWVTPPAYTGRPPVILSAAAREAALGPALAVPTGSVLVVRTSGARLDMAVSGGLAEAKAAAEEPAPAAKKEASRSTAGAEERRFTITGDGSAEVRGPARQPPWRFTAIPDRPPRIALAKAPERRSRGGLELSYKIEDDYGVTEAKAQFKAVAETPANPADAPKLSGAARPLFAPPDFALTLPNARTRNSVGQTVKDLSDNPYAGAEVTLTLVARDEAGNTGESQPSTLRLPERAFTKPLARALIEQRRLLALDARRSETVGVALDALLLAPEIFTPNAGQYLGLRNVAAELAHAGNDDALREVVASLWALAIAIEDGEITDIEKELRAAQDALREALERGASDEEIRQLTERLRAALDNYMRQLAEQLRNNPQQLARPLDSNTRVMRQQDLDNMISRMEQLSRSGDKDAARQLLEQLQQMLENLQMAQPSQGDGGSEMEQALNELGDMIRKQQQLRDRTFKEGQDARRGDHRNSQQRDGSAMQGLQQDQQALRDRLRKLQEEMARLGMGQRPGQQERGAEGQQGQEGQGGDQGEQGAGNALGEADSQMGDAQGRLGQGDARSAADAQGRALEALRRGAQNLADSMQQQMGEGGGEGDGPRDRLGRQGRSGERTDPLGRPLRGREFGDDRTVQIPGEIDVQRVRRILEELRRRLSDPARPPVELDYLERLLKDN